MKVKYFVSYFIKWHDPIYFPENIILIDKHPLKWVKEKENIRIISWQKIEEDYVE